MQLMQNILVKETSWVRVSKSSARGIKNRKIKPYASRYWLVKNAVLGSHSGKKEKQKGERSTHAGGFS